MTVNVTLTVVEPLDGRAWGWTLDRLEALERAGRPGEAADELAAVGGTGVALAAIAAGMLALVAAGVITVPPWATDAYLRLTGELQTAKKVTP